MKLYPIMVNMNSKPAVIIGGGEVAARKVSDLLEAGAMLKVISPEFNDEIIKAAGLYSDKVVLLKRKYEKNDLNGAFLVFSATNDSAVNADVFREAEDLGILINAVDDPPNCSFYVPSFVRKGDFLFALSTGGASPAMAARLRREIEKHIPEDIDLVLEKLKKARALLKEEECFSCMESSDRGKILKKIVSDDKLLESINSCSDDDMIDFLFDVKDSCD
ncbi:MAG TPA: bifunctional precorrin-2 dehydrogenase/sirohydrochlorin ferrochelatase [Spirochaetota bacterium]|nr:bifunctional precorrin-2 dehydrogenase/sirohydrochlorin ferrochelatase [Spirochaetota bacterium]HPS86650.1 bifunctional precorrin-2 dehydrogenase/sirohydrochlorin ferrochelatase [Spirochaetota bacterium]